MAGKKMEGNEEQRRAAAREAAAAGESPSARNETTGASKQRTHLRHGGSVTHDDRIAAQHRGKQQWHPGDLAEERIKDPAAGAERTFVEGERQEYTQEHERVFQAVSAAQAAHDGDAVLLDDIARRADIPLNETRALLHDLTRVHRLVTELAGVDTPDMGPRWEIKPRL
ncbi:hypothetical protein ACWC3X_42205 [Streptomyces populi]